MKNWTLEERRRHLGWTQVRLAAESGVDSSRISRLEAGEDHNPTYETVRKLERALKLRPGALLFGTDACEVTK